MTTEMPHANKLKVLVAGGGVAALEFVLALHDLAGDRVETRLLAPNRQFVYRPMAVEEPFTYVKAQRYPLDPLLRGAGVQQIEGQLAWIDHANQLAHALDESSFDYDALVLATGATATPPYEHATTIDDRRLEEVLGEIVRDIEAGFTKRIAFVAPSRIAWPLPLYELALMTAARAREMGREPNITVVTPEESPLAIFGSVASTAVAELLAEARIETITSGYAEMPSASELVITPGNRRVQVDRVIALPELHGPEIRGIPVGEDKFIRVDPYGRVPGVGPIYAAGDATNFAVKHGGIAAQQADAAAQSIAALAGAPVTPEPFQALVHGVLLTGRTPRYLTARITAERGFDSQITDIPPGSGVPAKIAARYLAPALQELDRQPA